MSIPIHRQQEIFNAALEHTVGPARDAFLAGACGDDPNLRQCVEALLASHTEAGTFLAKPAGPVSPTGTHLVPITEKAGDKIGRYKLLQQIGEGGCGVVYMADQEEPVRRRVALKVIKLGMDTKSVVARFEAERQALAIMDHPNIARVLDAGATETGRPYFVMELVRGVRITEFCDQQKLSTRARLELFMQVCSAIQHAHQKGIIHRDLKPSNVLVTIIDGVPVPKVIDFGIAKATNQQSLTDKTLFTAFEQFIGTPAYMSPEQAEMSGVDIDTRSDIYSLGVLLYELLTSQPPFDAGELVRSGLDGIRRTLRDQEPPKPSTRLNTLAHGELTTVARARHTEAPKLVHLVRGDLDWVVMKCLEKDRARRYETANALAADIQRHLTNEPVVARPPSAVYRLSRLARRNKLAFAAAGAVTVALLLGLIIASWQAVRATRAEQQARLAERAERAFSEQARADRDRASRAESDAQGKALIAKDAWAAARRNAYAAEINVALQALEENNLGRARDLLDRQRPKAGEEDLRGFEWRYLWQLCQGDELETFHEDAAHGAAFSPDGKWFACSGGKISVRETASRKLVARLGSPSSSLSFSPTAKLLASTTDFATKLWDTETWQEVRSLPDTTFGCRFSPDGRWLVTGMAQGWRLWNTQTWQPAGDCAGKPPTWHGRSALAFSPDGQFLVTGDSDVFEIVDHLRVWRLPGLEELPPIRFGGFAGGIPPISVAFSADGKQLIVGHWTGQIVVWEFASRKVLSTLYEHTGSVTAIALSADGKSFATTSTDRTVIIWDAATYKPLVRQRGHVGEVWAGAMSPDGTTVVSCSADDTTKLWSTGTRHNDTILDGPGILMGFLGGGRQLVSLSTNSVCLWTPENGARIDFPAPPSLRTIKGLSGKPYDIKPTEPFYAVGRGDGSVELWPMTVDAKAATWPAHDKEVAAVAFSADGKQLATSSANGEVKIWDSATRRETVRIEPVGRRLFRLGFSPDGRTLAGAGASSRIWVWDVATGRQVVELGDHGYAVPALAFSPDGKLLATAAMPTDEAHLWELPSGQLLATLKGHVQGVIAVAFSPDGKTLATASHDRKVKLWNVATRQELATFPFAAHLLSARFSPDGRALAIGCFNERGMRIQLVRAPSFEEIAPAERNQTETATSPR
jgi:WD40 repeat protein/tRNA A-37 threonylcarbamoyl transferase component Bud32